ncbi:MAG: ribosome-associated translation inhibitor RaiA [Thalassobaculum sp.]|uniref:ribosome hibernation-promoting factor, HPF/YfiA family n=1 Tax=Thalassobaculum sp. TaxID=2022740 RepID=UPI0032EE7D73
MKISVQGKQLDVGDALRERIESTVEQIAAKYFSNPIDATVTLSRQGPGFKADINVHVGKGISVTSEGTNGDAHAAFDGAAERIDKQLRRYKRRLRDHHRGHSEEAAPAAQYVLAAEADDTPEPETVDGWEPVVVAEMETTIEVLTVGEAVMRMDLASAPALMFRNRGHGGLNMIYRRPDGNVGWVDPPSRTQS